MARYNSDTYTELAVDNLTLNGNTIQSTNTDGNLNLTPDGSGNTVIKNAQLTGSSIEDSNGNELLVITATSSAVNELTLANAATGNNPSLAASGDDTNISITLTPKGTGGLVTASGATTGNAASVTADSLTSGDAVLISSNSADTSARSLLKLVNDNTAAVGAYGLEIQQDALVSTNFKRLLLLAGVTFWISDGTTANGNLSGTAGDICFNAGSNKPEYCTGTTNWTALA